ncbi:MAG: hypothetical protein K0S08_1814 [Gammaproteobacteria bacterium]|jgi:hypothetical protein|nr:hypothetical protein [Gammaproteobacteria bacterium]
MKILMKIFSIAFVCFLAPHLASAVIINIDETKNQTVNHEITFAGQPLFPKFLLSTQSKLPRYAIGRFVDNGKEYRVFFDSNDASTPYPVFEKLFLNLPSVQKLPISGGILTLANGEKVKAIIVPADLFSKGIILFLSETYTYEALTNRNMQRWVYDLNQTGAGTKRLIFREDIAPILPLFTTSDAA